MLRCYIRRFQGHGRLSFVKKVPDSGPQMNIVCLRRLLLARIHLPGLRKNMLIVGLEPTYFVYKGYC
jgi:hypothetical protein